MIERERMTRRARLLLAVCLVACKGGPPAPAADAGAAPIDVIAQLEKEAATRPSGTPAAEAVLKALDDAGLHVDRQKQVVALTVRASYCLGAFLGHGDDATGIVVCEYADEAAAAGGRELARARAGTARREVLVNRKTTLAVSLPRAGSGQAAPDDDALLATVTRVFAAL
jgi:hypothetical protein